MSSRHHGRSLDADTEFGKVPTVTQAIHERVENELNDVVWDVTNTGTASLQPRLTTRSAGLSRRLRYRYSCCSQRALVTTAECSTLARGTRAWWITCLCKVLIASPFSMFQAPLSSEQMLGSNSDRVDWIEADVTAEWSWKSADIWHDRAVFHFLIDPGDRARYHAHLKTVLKPGGSAIIATFAPDGPANCSGLPVVRYSPETLRLNWVPISR